MCANSQASQTAFLSIRGTISGAVYGAVVAALVGAAFYFMFFSAFHGFDFNVCLLPGGKDKLRGNMPSLPAAGSRFLIDVESGKKQTRTARGTAQGAMPLPIPRR